jgi:hypothetical protein
MKGAIPCDIGRPLLPPRAPLVIWQVFTWQAGGASHARRHTFRDIVLPAVAKMGHQRFSGRMRSAREIIP